MVSYTAKVTSYLQNRAGWVRGGGELPHPMARILRYAFAKSNQGQGRQQDFSGWVDEMVCTSVLMSLVEAVYVMTSLISDTIVSERKT